MDWMGTPTSWDGILTALCNSTTPTILSHKLALAALVYGIWCEGDNEDYSITRGLEEEA